MKNIQLVLLGNCGVGKTCITECMDGRIFSDQPKTIGVDLITKSINDYTHVKLWDVSGQFRFLTLAEYYIKRADAIMVVFDVTNRASFTDVNMWVKKIDDTLTKSLTVFLVATKCDLPRLVSSEEGIHVATELGLRYVEVSSKTAENIDALFETIVYNALENGDNNRAILSPTSAQGAALEIKEEEPSFLSIVGAFCTCSPTTDRDEEWRKQNGYLTDSPQSME
jgi:small GTP-binding protein